MKLNRLFILMLLMTAKFSTYADIALPKTLANNQTKYYFANVDSFPEYKFFVKKLINDKIYKVKQSGSFLLDAVGNSNNKLEVWAVNTKDKSKTNSFILESIVSKEPLEENTAHVAITFTFDKKNKLGYKQTIMKPECFNKKKQKQIVPLFSFQKPTINTNQLLYVAIFASLMLLSVFVVNKLNTKKTYA